MPPSARLYCVILDGLIGAGKSTFIKKIVDFYENQPLWKEEFTLVPVYENCDRFNNFGRFKPLELFYNNPDQYAMPVQMHIVNCLNATMKEITADLYSTKPIILLCDRSLYSPMYFTSLLNKRNLLSDFAKEIVSVYTEHEASNTESSCNLHYLLYFHLDTPVDVCLDRIHKRAREFEQTSVMDAGYLVQLSRSLDDHVAWWQKQLGEESRIHKLTSTDESDMEMILCEIRSRLR